MRKAGCVPGWCGRLHVWRTWWSRLGRVNYFPLRRTGDRLAAEPLGYGVIGNTADSGSVVLGSSPGTPAASRRQPSGLPIETVLPPSSSGPGHRPLTAAAPVQIRLGVPRPLARNHRFRASGASGTWTLPPRAGTCPVRTSPVAGSARYGANHAPPACPGRRRAHSVPLVRLAADSGPPSSSGPGHRPLTAAAPVQIRLGVREHDGGAGHHGDRPRRRWSHGSGRLEGRWPRVRRARTGSLRRGPSPGPWSPAPRRTRGRRRCPHGPAGRPAGGCRARR